MQAALASGDIVEQWHGNKKYLAFNTYEAGQQKRFHDKLHIDQGQTTMDVGSSAEISKWLQSRTWHKFSEVESVEDQTGSSTSKQGLLMIKDKDEHKKKCSCVKSDSMEKCGEYPERCQRLRVFLLLFRNISVQSLCVHAWCSLKSQSWCNKMSAEHARIQNRHKHWQ